MRIREWRFVTVGTDVELRIVRNRPWWQVWVPRVVAYQFAALDAIALYQALAKAARPVMVQEAHGPTEREEFVDDVTRAIVQADQYKGDGVSVARYGQWFEFIADLLAAKGYRKT